jgi:hypothetical protein
MREKSRRGGKRKKYFVESYKDVPKQIHKGVSKTDTQRLPCKQMHIGYPESN